MVAIRTDRCWCQGELASHYSLPEIQDQAILLFSILDYDDLYKFKTYVVILCSLSETAN